MLRFAVIGHPVAHSLSPIMHAANFASLGLEAQYGKFDVKPEGVATFVRSCRDAGFLGLNVTVPHKVAVIELLDSIDESVKLYGACNTIKFEPDGRLSGYNTDVAGFLSCLEAHKVSLKGKRAVIIGCGGAGSALARACALGGATAVAVAARTASHAESLAAELGERARAVCARGAAGSEALADVVRNADLIVNATPVGLKENDESVIPPGAFHAGQFVLDIIPTRCFPPTAAAARSAGAVAAGGLEFLVEQGARAFEIWTGLTADRTAMMNAVMQEG